MTPRTGRPKVDNPKDKSIKVRFDDDLYSRINDYAEEYELTRAEVILKGVKLLLEQKK